MSIQSDTLRVSRELRRAVLTASDDEARQLIRAWARAWDQIRREFTAAAEDLATRAAGGTPITIGQVRRLDRARNAVKAAEDQIDQALRAQRQRIGSTLTDVVTQTAELNARMIATQLPPTEGTQAQLATMFDRVSPDALDAIVRRTTQQITSMRVPLSTSANESMLRALVRAIPEGASPRTAAAQMVDDVEGAFNGGLARALNVSRTEILDAYRYGAMAQQNASSDILQGWIWTAELDSKTCPSCVAEAGSVHPLDEFGPDDHQSGRCGRTPYVKSWDDLGFTGVTEPDDDIETGPDWFGRQDEATQLAIVGPARLDALNTGQVSWDQMSVVRRNPGWRDSRVAATLGDLDL